MIELMVFVIIATAVGILADMGDMFNNKEDE